MDEFAPDLLLLDVMMPRLSGFEVCKKIRANPETKDLLILMVTALNEAADFERGVQAGTDDFLTKPVNKVELLCRIRSLLRVRHLKTQLDRTLAYLAEFEAASREESTRSGEAGISGQEQRLSQDVRFGPTPRCSACSSHPHGS